MTAETIGTVTNMCTTIAATSVGIVLCYLLFLMRLRLYVRHEEPSLMEDLPARLAPGREVAEKAWQEAGFTRFARLRTREALRASGYQELQTYFSADGMSLGTETTDSKERPRMIYSFYRDKPPLLTHSLGLLKIDLEFIRLNQVRPTDLQKLRQAHEAMRGEDALVISSPEQFRSLFSEQGRIQQEWMQKNWFTIQESPGVYRASMSVLLIQLMHFVREMTIGRVANVVATPRKEVAGSIVVALLLAIASPFLAPHIPLFFLLAFLTLFLVEVLVGETSVFLVMMPSLAILVTCIEPESLGIAFFCALLGTGAGRTTRVVLDARKRGGTMGRGALAFSVCAFALALSLAHLHATIWAP